ncbi:MAG: energy transducer TonB [Sphingobacteriales bacterium]|nr:MAG: energy transducer TonB [Sphingobacteriales bacterium]
MDFRNFSVCTLPSQLNMQIRFLIPLFALATVSTHDSFAQKQKSARKPTSVVPMKPAVFKYVEQMPQFDGDLIAFLIQHTVYPKEARENGIGGRVNVKVVIDETGQVTDPIIEKSVHPLLDAEALRVVKLMPPWKPGMQNGHAVRVFYTIPIKFIIS